MKRSYITTDIQADIQVTEQNLNDICDEFNLDYISLNDLDPTYMRTEELNINDKNFKTKTYALPKKAPVTIDWIISKINAMQNTEKAYTNLSKEFKKISERYTDMNIYPTTYGIGVNTLYANTSNEFKEITSILDNADIEYKLQWSDALWVKRIIISKSKENIQKINDLKIKKVA